MRASYRHLACAMLLACVALCVATRVVVGSGIDDGDDELPCFEREYAENVWLEPLLVLLIAALSTTAFAAMAWWSNHFYPLASPAGVATSIEPSAIVASIPTAPTLTWSTMRISPSKPRASTKVITAARPAAPESELIKRVPVSGERAEGAPLSVDVESPSQAKQQPGGVERVPLTRAAAAKQKAAEEAAAKAKETEKKSSPPGGATIESRTRVESPPTVVAPSSKLSELKVDLDQASVQATEGEQQSTVSNGGKAKQKKKKQAKSEAKDVI